MSIQLDLHEISFIDLFSGNDGTEDEYTLEWLMKAMERGNQASLQMLWDQKTIHDKIVQVDCEEFMTKKKGLSKFFQGMEQNGFVLLTEVMAFQ